MTCDSDSRVALKAAGAPEANEIEITPAMVEVGVSALQDFNVNEDNLEWVVSSVFDAMCRKMWCRPQ